jgi:phage terminase small subunit
MASGAVTSSPSSRGAIGSPAQRRRGHPRLTAARGVRIAREPFFPRAILASSAPRAPNGLEAPGKALWRAVHNDLPSGWEFDGRDLQLLAQACRQIDVVAGLEAEIERRGLFVRGSQMQSRLNPAIAEARQGRLAVGRLLGLIHMPTDEDSKPVSAASERARKAAQSRWRQRAMRQAGADG